MIASVLNIPFKLPMPKISGFIAMGVTSSYPISFLRWHHAEVSINRFCRKHLLPCGTAEPLDYIRFWLSRSCPSFLDPMPDRPSSRMMPFTSPSIFSAQPFSCFRGVRKRSTRYETVTTVFQPLPRLPIARIFWIVRSLTSMSKFSGRRSDIYGRA